MAFSGYHGRGLGGTPSQPTSEPAEAKATAPRASNVIDFFAARARRHGEGGFEPEPIEDGPRLETALEVSNRLCDEMIAALPPDERERLIASLKPRRLA